jgi:hypothetical protein
MLKIFTNTVILALALNFSFSAHAWDDDTVTKLQAQALVSAVQMQKETSVLLKEMDAIGTEIGTSMDDSGGLIKALGVNETAAMDAKQKIDVLIQVMTKSTNADEIFTGYAEVVTLANEIRALNKDSKDLVK